jgi:hypothetical protein
LLQEHFTNKLAFETWYLSVLRIRIILMRLRLREIF